MAKPIGVPRAGKRKIVADLLELVDRGRQAGRFPARLCPGA